MKMNNNVLKNMDTLEFLSHSKNIFEEFNGKVPKQIDIEVTTKCNLKCRYCPSVDGHLPTGNMDFELFKSIVDRVDFDTTLVAWLNGEPLLHPRYFEIVKYITDRKHRCYITTNGTIWNNDLFEHLTDDTSVYQIIFSLDGLHEGNSKSIELARPGSDRQKILANIERFRQLKIKKNAKIDMALKICDRGQDYQEFEEYIDYWLTQPGVDFVCFGKPLIAENQEGFRQYPCQYSDSNFMVIRWDGTLARCSYNEKASFPDWNFGKIDMTTPLLEIYNNKKYTKFREEQAKGVFSGPCKTCGYAYTGHGYRGEIYQRNPKARLYGKKIYFRQDYYNQIFSLTQKEKSDKYYTN